MRDLSSSWTSGCTTPDCTPVSYTHLFKKIWDVILVLLLAQTLFTAVSGDVLSVVGEFVYSSKTVVCTALTACELCGVGAVSYTHLDVYTSQLLEEAYTGTLELNDYVNLLYNSGWARKYNIQLPGIKWEKISDGIHKRIEKMTH